VKNNKIAINSTTSKAREKQRFKILSNLEIFDACLTEFKNKQILL
jgi:hypothetical protein